MSASISGMSTPVFDLAVTQAVCDVLAQTDSPGLTGSEIRAALEHARISELESGPNKRTSLRITLHNAQVDRSSGATLAAFVNAAMRPALYVDNPGRWQLLRGQLDAVLVLYGLRINNAGQLAYRCDTARSLPEAAELAGTLHTELRHRGCHETVLAYCREELINHSLFHAISEAAKSIPDRIRGMTGVRLDGAELYDYVFGSKSSAPSLRINPLETQSDESEQRGFKSILVGIHGHYRNPRAHRTRLGAIEDRADFLDAFGLFSYVHRRLDESVVE